MKALLSVLFLLLSATVLSQPYLNQLYDFEFTSDWGWSVFTKSDGNFFVISSGRSAQVGQWRLFAKLIRPDSTEVYTKTIFKSSSYSYYQGLPGSCKKTPSGNYILPVTAVRTIFPSTYIKLAGLAKLDSAGDLIWVQWYSDTTQYNEIANNCNITASGNYLLASTRENGATLKGMLRYLDSNGQVLWTRTHTQAIDYATVEEITSGNIVVGSAKSTLVGTGANVYYRNQPWFLVYDSLGTITNNVMWDTNYLGGCVFKDNNGGYFHFGQLDSLIDVQATILNYPDYVARLDNNFNVIWLRNFADMNGHKYIGTVKQLHDNNYLIVGNYSEVIGWACKLDHNGYIMWQNFYSVGADSAFGYLVDAAEQPDGKIIFTGTSSSSLNAPQRGQDIWMLMVDAMGCPAPNCAPTMVNDVKREDDLNIYPNPTTGRFSLHSQEEVMLMLMDQQGQIVGSYKINVGDNTIMFDEKLSTGLYFGRLHGANGAVYKPLKIMLQR